MYSVCWLVGSGPREIANGLPTGEISRRGTKLRSLDFEWILSLRLLDFFFFVAVGGST